MIVFHWLHLAFMLPFAWISALTCRKQEFAIRYEKLRAYCLKTIHIFRIHFEVIMKDELPCDVPLYFVSNHQGTADPLLIVAALPTPMTFVSKVENDRIPILSSWSKSIELIYFDRDDSKSAIHMLRESARYLKRKRNLLIFPEGTRSKGSEMLPFKSGAIKPAYLGKACIVPIAQINSYEMGKAMKHKGKLRIVVGEPMYFENYKDIELDSLSELLQAKIQVLLTEYAI